MAGCNKGSVWSDSDVLAAAITRQIAERLSPSREPIVATQLRQAPTDVGNSTDQVLQPLVCALAHFVQTVEQSFAMYVRSQLSIQNVENYKKLITIVNCPEVIPDTCQREATVKELTECLLAACKCKDD